jgi:hypothetical protein
LMRASWSDYLPHSTIDLVMAEELDISSFRSVPSLASTIRRPPTTARTYLHCLGFVIEHLRFVPHTLSAVQKNEPVQHSIDLKKRLKSAKHWGWRYVLASDKSWFYITINHETIAKRVEFVPPINPKKIISNPKPIRTIFCWPLGFRIIHVLPKRDILTRRISATIPLMKSIAFARPVMEKTTDDLSSCILIKQDYTAPDASMFISVKMEW